MNLKEIPIPWLAVKKNVKRKQNVHNLHHSDVERARINRSTSTISNAEYLNISVIRIMK